MENALALLENSQRRADDLAKRLPEKRAQLKLNSRKPTLTRSLVIRNKLTSLVGQSKPSHEDEPTIGAEIRELEAAMRDALALSGHARQQVHKLTTTTLSKERALIAPITILPFDILSRIFESCTMDDWKSPLLIGRICRFWRLLFYKRLEHGASWTKMTATGASHLYILREVNSAASTSKLPK